MSRWSRHVPGPAGDPEWERARRDHPAWAGRDDTPRTRDLAETWAETTWLDPEDWEGIDSLLASTVVTPPDASVHADIVRASDQLCSLLTCEIISADQMTNPLLEFWSVARRAGPAAARPVEVLISALSHRHLVAADEVRAACRAVADRDGAPFHHRAA